MATTTTRKKTKVISEKITREKAESLLSDYAHAQARTKELTGKMEAEIAKVRDKYTDKLSELGDVVEESFEWLQAYGMQNKNLFVDKRAMELTHGKLGFRFGTPKLDKAKGFSWDAIASLVSEKGYDDYVRTKSEVNKELLIENRNSADVNKILSECKMSIIQDETFFVEAKEEATAS